MNVMQKISKSTAIALSAGRPDVREPVPALGDVSPEYARLAEKRAQVLREMRENFDEMVAAGQRAAARSDAGNPLAPVAPSDRQKAARIADIIGDPQWESPVASDPSDGEMVTRQEELEEALVIIDRRLSAERMMASSVICEQIRDRHRDLVVEICEAMIELHRVAKRYDEFADDLNAKGIAWSALWPMRVDVGANVGDFQPVTAYLREAARHGFIPKAYVPEDLQ